MSCHISTSQGKTNPSSDYADQVWTWDNEDGATFYFDVGEIVRFRVETEEWHDQIPNAPELADGPALERKPPYSIVVCYYVSTFMVYTAHIFSRARCRWPVWGPLPGGKSAPDDLIA